MFTKNHKPHNKGKIKDLKKLCDCIGDCKNSVHTVSLIPRKFFNRNSKNNLYYKRKTKFIICLNCFKYSEVANASKFCSYKCQNDKARIDFILSVENGLNDGLLSCNVGRLSGHYHTYFKNKFYNDLYVKKILPCCKIPIHKNWINENGDVAIMEINHINGNHQNNKLNNLEYICSNCHSGRTLSPAEMKKRGIKGRARNKYQEIMYNYK